MKALRRFVARLAGLSGRRGNERRLQEEIAEHLDQQTAANIAAGMSSEEARRQAVLKFGAVERIKEDYRERQSLPFVESLLQDTRYAVRRLRKSPGFSVVAVMTLALGIGANTTLFSLHNSLMLKSLPVRNPEQIVMVKGGPARLASEFFTCAIWSQFDERQHALPNFDGMFAWSPSEFNLAITGEADRVEGLWVTGAFFETLGVSPARGRLLARADDQPGGGPGGPAAVLSYPFWQRRFGGSSDVIGRTLNIARVPYTIVGVTPQNFFGPVVGGTFDVVLPVQTEPLMKPGNSLLINPRSVMFNVMGRLKAGGSLGAATAELRAIQPHIREATRPSDTTGPYLEEPFTLISAASGVEFPAPAGLRGRYRLPLLILLAAAGTLLLIGCSNIANLLLARAAGRTHEMNVRLALGGSRWRIARESFCGISPPGCRWHRSWPPCHLLERTFVGSASGPQCHRCAGIP
jgi:predicted permease